MSRPFNPSKFWLGKKHSIDSKKKMSESKKKAGITPPSRLGTKHTEEHKKYMSEIMKMKIRQGVFIPNRIPWNKEKRMPQFTGKNHWHWKGNAVKHADKRIRRSVEYIIWRKAVFQRDNFTCRFCEEKGERIVADHIKPFALFPELRLAIDNGRTLCLSCHSKTLTYGRQKEKLERILYE